MRLEIIISGTTLDSRTHNFTSDWQSAHVLERGKITIL